ncbi:MAG: hypothetical protein KJ607_03750 [Bacteroidetes bacterium]|nr:hypothetical protein [Bacteroidota bacterium]
MIPKIIHQTWKSENVPVRWRKFVSKCQKLNPEWEYRLWTDHANNDFVEKEFPHFYNIYSGFTKNIMRADVVRYLIMNKIGGVYLDLDYEVLKPFDFTGFSVILPMNRSRTYGDPEDTLGNCILASVPGHIFWSDVLQALRENPVIVKEYTDVVCATGPMLLTRIYNTGNYPDIHTPDRCFFHPSPPKNRNEYNDLVNNGITVGIHHGWGSWKERFTKTYLKRKVKKILKHND